jgi:bla regulator protein blaR1
MCGVRRRSLPLLIAFVAGAAVVPLLGQAQPDQKTQSFQVASIRPNKSMEGREGVRIGLQPGGRFTAVGLQLRELIRVAYGDQTLLRNQVIGGPDWLASDRFDIVAKAESDFGPPASEGGPPKELLGMVRRLLEDRCQLKVHLETRELPIYNLVVARSDRQLGPKIRRSAGDCIRPDSSGAPPTASDPDRFCGSMRNNFNGVLSATAVTMQSWVGFLGNLPLVSRVVRDRTGLAGEFDLQMEFVPAFLQNPNPDGSAVPNPAADSGPNLFTALQEQLGLKLESTKGPVDVLVIDHVERPTED